MGEVIKAAMPDYIAQKIALKVQCYNIMREMTMINELCNTL